jgi:iron complex outermembrane receptor protein
MRPPGRLSASERVFLLAMVFSSAAFGLLGATEAGAQTDGNEKLSAEAALAKSPLEDIVVTARKTAERLSDVPMSISVLTGDDLEKTGSLNLQDLGQEVPGLNVVSSGPGQNQLTLRGLAGNNTVGLYVDDTPVSILNSQVAPDNWFMDPSLVDLQRVEVLKGPQGTLYGSSSLGGTVRYITNQPDLSQTHVMAKATGSYTDGGGPNEEFDALLNQPLIPGYLAIRAMAYQRDYDGYVDRYPTAPNNYFAALSGPVDKNVNTEHTYGGRIALEAKPIEDFSATLSATYQTMDLGAPFTFDKPPGSLDSPVQSRLVGEPSTDSSALDALTLKADLLSVHLTSSTSYFDRTLQASEDDSKAMTFIFPLPGNPVYPSQVTSRAVNHNFVEETRASWNGGPVHALVGVYYAHAVADGNIIWPQVPQYVPVLGDDIIFYGYNDFVDLQRAVFGEITFDVAQGLQVTVGARHFKQSQTLHNDQGGVLGGGPISPTNESIQAQGTTPKYDFSYHLAPDLMVYATAAEGYREGSPGFPVPAECINQYRELGYPNAAVGSPTSYRPDTIWSYELGAKGAWLDNSLGIDAAVYSIQWKDIQQTIILACGYTFTGNFGSATSKGVELEMHYNPVGALQLRLSVAANEAKLTSTVAGAQGQAGQTIEYAPKWMGSLSAEYRREIAANASAYVRGSINTTTHQNTGYATDSPFFNLPGYSIANLRVGVKHGRWQSSLFAENLLDKHAETDLYNAYGSNVPNTQPLGLNRPRTVGLDVRFDY